MLIEIDICSLLPSDALATIATRLRRTFPDLRVRCGNATDDGLAREMLHRSGQVTVPARVWQDARLDPIDFDALVVAAAAQGNFSLRLDDDCDHHEDDAADRLLEVALQMVTRCQRYLPGRNRHSASGLFDKALALHRSLHDLRKPLVAADFHHTLDTRRWVVRLDSEASLAVQVAALFHDVERLVSESDKRIEQHAADYRAFKEAHAAVGASMSRAALNRLGASGADIDRIAELIAAHERPDGDAEKQLLNEADALSFFSLNSCGFLTYYGLDHTLKKIAYTLGRLGPRGRRELGRVRLRGDIAALLAEAMQRRSPSVSVEGAP